MSPKAESCPLIKRGKKSYLSKKKSHYAGFLINCQQALISHVDSNHESARVFFQPDSDLLWEAQKKHFLVSATF